MNLAVFGNIVTSFSWFGVNMLGIGLHCYGFMDAAFKWLMIFIGSQVAIILLGLVPQKLWRSFRTPDFLSHSVCDTELNVRCSMFPKGRAGRAARRTLIPEGRLTVAMPAPLVEALQAPNFDHETHKRHEIDHRRARISPRWRGATAPPIFHRRLRRWPQIVGRGSHFRRCAAMA